MNEKLYQDGLTLEDAFFRKRDAELIEQHRKLAKLHRTRQALAELSGVTNSKVLDKLIELEISPDILSALAVVPLVEVVWADGKIEPGESEAVLAAAAGNGIKPGSIDYALLEAWLKHRPSEKLLEAWIHYIAGLCEVMGPKEREALKADLLGRARNVAEAAGGFLGLTSKVSSEERAILKKLENAFTLSP